MRGVKGPLLVAILLALALVPLGARGPFPFALLLVCISLPFVITSVGQVFNNNAASYAHGPLLGGRAFVVLSLPLLVVAQALSTIVRSGVAVPSFSMLQSFLFLAALGAFFVLASNSLAEKQGLRRLVFVLIAIATLEAAYAVFNLLSGNERLLIYNRWAYPDSATGTLISRNHFAFLMEMTLPLSLVSGTLFAATALRRQARTTPSDTTARRILAGAAAAIIALALVFSRSRMGIFSFIMALATVGTMNALLRPGGQGQDRRSGRSAAPAILAVVVLGYAVVIGIDPVLERFFDVAQDMENGRWPIWNAALGMFHDRPILGHGWGSFEGLYPGYSGRPTGLYYDHAHNEYLEVLAEAGVVGLGLVAWLVFLFVRRLYRALSRPLNPLQRGTVFALGVGITSVLFHSAADFGLRVPGVALTFVVVVALFVRVTDEPALLES
ncbi:MAG: O-antigen ligase family protein [Candidatus Binatia bacterium]